jgi:hypothetical protein
VDTEAFRFVLRSLIIQEGRRIESPGLQFFWSTSVKIIRFFVNPAGSQSPSDGVCERFIFLSEKFSIDYTTQLREFIAAPITWTG